MSINSERNIDMGVIILTGKSCVGKDSVRGELEKLGFKNIVSYTSRPMRVGEKGGVDYNFVGREISGIKIKYTFIILCVQICLNIIAAIINSLDRCNDKNKKTKSE